MVRKGVGIILLLVFTIFSISNFVSAECVGSPYLNCNGITNNDECYYIYPTVCDWSYSSLICNNVEGKTCADITSQSACTSQVGCYWNGCSGPCCGLGTNSICLDVTNYRCSGQKIQYERITTHCDGVNPTCSGSSVDTGWITSDDCSSYGFGYCPEGTYSGSSMSCSFCPTSCSTSNYVCGDWTFCGQIKNCGTCSTFPNSVMGCGGLTSSYDGRCYIAGCAPGYGNCDGNMFNSNGCETTLGTNTNCAYCGNVCGSGTSCVNNVCQTVCTPACSGKNCGSDGCGGYCGSYGSSRPGYTCLDGTWTLNPPTLFCGDGILTSTSPLYEQCDDGNTASGDGCSSTCNVESSYTCNSASPTCCYSNSPTVSWKLNGNSFSGGNIREGDTLTMTVNNDLCLADGTSVYLNIYLQDGTLLTPNPLQGHANSGANTISATYTITQSFLNSISTTNGIYLQTGSPTITSPVISVTPVMCDLTSASWGTTSILEGNSVRLNIAGTNCNGKTINFDVEKQNIIGHTPVTTNPSSITYSGAGSYGVWTAEWASSLLGGDPNYYFIASVSGMSESITSSDPKLQVYQPASCGNGVVDSGETCSTCLADVPCSSGTHCDTGTCIPDCVLNNAIWSTTSAVGGEQVHLTVTGTNCNGQTVSFEVREDDSPLGTDEVSTNPSNVIMNSNLATGTWTAEWPDVGGETTPEYYFIASVNENTIESSRSSANELHVTQNSYCGNGIIDSGEECDGSQLGGETCASVMGAGYTGTLSCSSCTLITTNCVSPCTLTSASWSQVNAAIGDTVKLNIQGNSNCIGKNINFEVWEKDSGILNPDDPVTTNPNSIIYGVPNNYTSWVVEWQDDNEVLGGQTNPPEYYFKASVVGASPAETITSSNTNSDDPLLLRPINVDVLCSAINHCSDYATQEDCNSDASLCNVGEGDLTDTVTCGGSLNPVTGCYDNTNCGCSWDNGVCKPSWTSTSSCGVCGNGFREAGEECDDGNTASGDGCSSTCTFEPNINNPCSLGLTLCSDGTCSLNCYSTDTGVAACNYNGICDTGEGCSCSDCNGETDTCATDLTCSILDTGCCSSTSDGICNPYCSSVDPDCAGTCGNGIKDLGEECDLGIRNSVAGSGCSSSCTLQPITNPTDGCPEGTALCTDGTCSLNCYSTDEGINNDFSQCTLDNACATGLTCSIVDQACCNDNSDGYCNEYCAFSDPDCITQGTEVFSPGTCTYTDNSQDTCADDGMLTRSLAALWTWAIGNEITQTDPLGKHTQCAPINDTIVCPASVEVPFFGIYSFVTAIIIVVLIYLIYLLNRKKKSNIKNINKNVNSISIINHIKNNSKGKKKK
jgi:cysteine-rich repeat protein